jgi:hypothetical protein
MLPAPSLQVTLLEGQPLLWTRIRRVSDRAFALAGGLRACICEHVAIAKGVGSGAAQIELVSRPGAKQLFGCRAGWGRI